MNLKLLFLMFVFSLVCYQRGAAQSTCSSQFNPFETCGWDHVNKEFVFVGRVASVESKPQSMSDRKKIVVDVETRIKGDVGPRVELLLNQECYGVVVKDRKYIFTAGSPTDNKVSGLICDKWSTEIQDYAPQEIEQILAGLRSVVRSEKQPSLIGKVTQHFGNKNSRFSVRSSSLNTKLGYDSEYARPLVDVVVVAQRGDGKRFIAKTNSEGEYEFKELPTGEYEVYANLPKEYDVEANGAFIKTAGGKKYIEIDDSICSKKVSFVAQLFGTLSGRIRNVTERLAVSPVIDLVRADSGSDLNTSFETGSLPLKSYSVTKTGAEASVSFMIVDIPVGRYLLFVTPRTNDSQAIYYPGVREREKAGIIEIEVGKTTNVDFGLP